MEMKKLEELRDVVYEFEGLLELATRNDGNAEKFQHLIRLKSDTIARLVDELSVSEENPDEHELIHEAVEDNFEKEIIKTDMDETVETETVDAEMERDGTEAVESEADIIEDPQIIEPQIEEHKDDKIEDVKLDAPVLGSENKKSNRVVREPIRSHFSINDIFRFRRELFKGNDAEMRRALAEISDLATFSDAERYVEDVLKLKREEEATESFIDILSKYFK